jgi:poly(A) polymerase
MDGGTTKKKLDFGEKLRPWFTPMTVSPPTEADRQCTKALISYLDESAPLETPEETAEREKVTLELKKLTGDWVKWVSINKRGVPEEDAQPGRLFLSGSYRLSVNEKGADIDTILVCPIHVKREDFFSEESEGLIDRLKSNPNVTHILPIPTATVPLIEVVWSGIELDVLFAGLQQSDVPNHPDDLLDDSLLLKLDQGSVLSLNGPRTTELIVKLVPNFETFCVVLRALRLWAKRRGIYSNKLGFLGGVNFAILAAFACQLWPKETASRCLTRLMILVTEWKWPAPIRLCHPYEVEGASQNEHLRAWDPQSRFNARDKMPIITPAFPNFNSSQSVTASTLDIMRGEFQRGREEARVVMNKGEQCMSEDWASFFQKTDYFVRFPVYVSIVARANDTIALKKWSGFVESRIRKFVEFLERLPLFEIFPYQKAFDVVPDEDAGEDEELKLPGRRWFVGLRVDTILARMKHATSSTINLEGAVVSFSNFVLSSTREEGTTVDVNILKFKDMLRFFPELYPEGLREAYRTHKEIQVQAQKEIERSRSLDTKQNGGAGAGTQGLLGDDEDGEERLGSGGVAVDVDSQNRLVEDLKKRKRRRNNVDLCELDVIPASSKIVVIGSNIGNQQQQPLFRPMPLKVNLA